MLQEHYILNKYYYFSLIKKKKFHGSHKNLKHHNFNNMIIMRNVIWILEWILKGHMTLKTGVMAAENVEFIWINYILKDIKTEISYFKC